MSYKDDIIALLNKVYRNCTFTDVLLTPVGSAIDKVYTYLEALKNNFFFDTLDEDGCSYFEALLGITDASDDLDTQRAVIQARWLSSNHNSLTLIQNVLNAFTDGAEADFTGGKIVINLADFMEAEYFEKLIDSIELIKPAHLGIKFIYNITGAGGFYAGAGVTESITTTFYCTE